MQSINHRNKYKLFYNINFEALAYIVWLLGFEVEIRLLFFFNLHLFSLIFSSKKKTLRIEVKHTISCIKIAEQVQRNE